MILEQIKNHSIWDIVGIEKISQSYHIDQNLAYLKTLPLADLKTIFIQYRFFTQYYISDLALLVSKLPTCTLKNVLADILAEELGSGEVRHSHPVLYDDFLKSLGLTIEDLDKPKANCIIYLDKVSASLRERSWAYGIGLRGMGGECLCQIYLSTMYNFFIQNPAIQAIKEQINWTFWDIHIGEVDLNHQRLLRSAIDELININPELVDDIIAGYQESKLAWDNFWQQIYDKGKK